VTEEEVIPRNSRIEFWRRGLRRLSRFEARVDAVITRIAMVRLISFLMAFLCGIASAYDREWMPYGPIAAVSFLVFLVAVILHRKPYRLMPRVQKRVVTITETIARATHDWEKIADDGAAYADPGRPDLQELQVFGRGSLYQLVNRSGLPWGRNRVAELLRDGTAQAEMAERQEAARELARLSVLRHRVEAEARLVDVSPDDVEKMLTWAETKPESLSWLDTAFWLSLVLVPATFVQVVMTLSFGWITFWQVSFLAQLVLFGATTSKLTAYYLHLIGNPKERPMVALRTVFERVERVRLKSLYLSRLQADWRGDQSQVPPSERIGRFEGIVDALAVRHGALLYSVLAICFLWEVIQCRRLERWRGRFGAALRRDLEALAEFECLGSVGAFAAEHPTFAWPVVHGSPQGGLPISTVAMGHPLIPADRRKVNDFRMDEMGQLVLVTGSNMSGKSTFLRTVGSNARLALGGVPVCAESFSIVDCTLITSIQVVDSPEEGLSRFYAEVKRLAAVVRAVEAAGNDGRPSCLYLVDEMLSGTNSRERRIASRTIVRRLVEATASFGLVTTHDLALVSVEAELPGRVVCTHFTDRFDGTNMYFDYVMKPGVAKTTNALLVLRLEGIEVLDEAGPVG